ncbi:MAG: bifunctional glutamate N-acetyltransferase/amino-acid acetyltransferase ArgJ [Pseudomonadota bacterium]
MKEQTVLRGFRFSAVSARVKEKGPERPDLGLIVSDSVCITAAVTTTNLVYAAPVELTRERLAGGSCMAILANSGNANACTGRRGRDDAVNLTGEVARVLGIDPELVVPMSTGVIGVPLPVERMTGQIPALAAGLDPSRHGDFARSIMTTDLVPKTAVVEGSLSHCSIKLVGAAKGSGMIAPNMATMLAAVLSDVRVDIGFLRECLAEACEVSFNRITVDGDTSTNDTLVVMTGGASDAADLGSAELDRRTFATMLARVCTDLARQIVLDGEGATKVVTIRVRGARGKPDATRIARVIAESPLVKTAFHGEDPNWGRVLAAAGRAGVEFDPRVVDLFIGPVAVLHDGAPVEGDWERSAHAVMQEREWEAVLDLKSGQAEAELLTTDLSEEYVGINADYRS